MKDGGPRSPHPLGRMEEGKLQQKWEQMLKKQGRRRGGYRKTHPYLIWGFTTVFTIRFIHSELMFSRVLFSTNFQYQRTEYNFKYFFSTPNVYHTIELKGDVLLYTKIKIMFHKIRIVFPTTVFWVMFSYIPRLSKKTKQLLCYRKKIK